MTFVRRFADTIADKMRLLRGPKSGKTADMGVEILLLVLALCGLAYCVRKSAAKFHSPVLTVAVWAGTSAFAALLAIWIYALSTD